MVASRIKCGGFSDSRKVSCVKSIVGVFARVLVVSALSAKSSWFRLDL